MQHLISRLATRTPHHTLNSAIRIQQLAKQQLAHVTSQSGYAKHVGNCLAPFGGDSGYHVANMWINQKPSKTIDFPCIWGVRGAILGSSWAKLGSSLGQVGLVLGSSLGQDGVVGASWCLDGL